VKKRIKVWGFFNYNKSSTRLAAYSYGEHRVGGNCSPQKSHVLPPDIKARLLLCNSVHCESVRYNTVCSLLFQSLGLSGSPRSYAGPRCVRGRNHGWKVEGDRGLGPKSRAGCWVREGVAPSRCEGPGYYPRKILKTKMLNPAFWWLLAVKFLAFWKLRPKVRGPIHCWSPNLKVGDQSPRSLRLLRLWVYLTGFALPETF